MAIYYLNVKVVSRSNGSRATRAAAYRAGERIRDQRSSEVYDHTKRKDVAHSEILLPTEYASRADMHWALDRSTLWNAAEHAGRRRNSRLAREILVYLPPELNPAQRTDLSRSFARGLADRYGNAVDLAIHEPRPHADHRHHHAHLLMTTRQVGPDGLGARTTMDVSEKDRHARGLGSSRDEFLWMRGRWAELTNEALHEAGLAARVDHRSYQAQGIDREPKPRIPAAILYSERRSGRSHPAGDAIRARYQERVAARLLGGEQLARVVERQKTENQQRAINSEARKDATRKIAYGALTRQEVNQLRREKQKARAEEMTNKQRRFDHRDTADDSARRWFEYRQKQLREMESAPERNPAQHRTPSMPPLTAEDAARNWRAYRDRQLQAEASHEASREGRKPSAGKGHGRAADEAAKDSQRSRDYSMEF